MSARTSAIDPTDRGLDLFDADTLRHPDISRPTRQERSVICIPGQDPRTSPAVVHAAKRAGKPRPAITPNLPERRAKQTQIAQRHPRPASPFLTALGRVRSDSLALALRLHPPRRYGERSRDHPIEQSDSPRDIETLPICSPRRYRLNGRVDLWIRRRLDLHLRYCDVPHRNGRAACTNPPIVIVTPPTKPIRDEPLAQARSRTKITSEHTTFIRAFYGCSSVLSTEAAHPIPGLPQSGEPAGSRDQYATRTSRAPHKRSAGVVMTGSCAQPRALGSS